MKENLLGIINIKKSFRFCNIRQNKYLVFLCFVIFFTLYLLGADFGKFEPDYYSAHSITMSHLHKNGEIIELLKTIPNSASGVLPLWVFGFFKGFVLHKLLSLLLFLGIISLIWKTTKLNEFGRYFIMALLISPMMISATAWILPEIFSLFLLITICVLTLTYPSLSVVLSIFIPLCRQTFVVLLWGRLFFSPKNIRIYFLVSVFSAFGLFLLFLIWGGLVPPKLAGVHLTPSIKAPIIALLIFSLYFIFDNFNKFLKDSINKKKLLISIIVSTIIVIVGLIQPPLYGGGYIFSRIEEKSLIIAFFTEVLVLTLFFYKTKFNIIIFILLASFSFSTTNFMFLKYIDFYFFGFLAYGISDIDENVRINFINYARSCFIFQLFSISLAIFYYLI